MEFFSQSGSIIRQGFKKCLEAILNQGLLPPYNSHRSGVLRLSQWFSPVPPGYLLSTGIRELTELFKDVPEVSDDHPYTEFPIWRWVSGKGGYILNANEMRSYIATKKMGQSPKILGN